MRIYQSPYILLKNNNVGAKVNKKEEKACFSLPEIYLSF